MEAKIIWSRIAVQFAVIIASNLAITKMNAVSRFCVLFARIMPILSRSALLSGIARMLLYRTRVKKLTRWINGRQKKILRKRTWRGQSRKQNIKQNNNKHMWKKV